MINFFIPTSGAIPPDHNTQLHTMMSVCMPLCRHEELAFVRLGNSVEADFHHQETPVDSLAVHQRFSLRLQQLYWVASVLTLSQGALLHVLRSCCRVSVTQRPQMCTEALPY